MIYSFDCEACGGELQLTIVRVTEGEAIVRRDDWPRECPWCGVPTGVDTEDFLVKHEDVISDLLEAEDEE